MAPHQTWQRLRQVFLNGVSLNSTNYILMKPNQVVLAKTMFFISGMPGSGKSYFASRIPSDKKVLDLDRIGHVVGKKWVADLSKITEVPDFMIGTCDNLSDVRKRLVTVCGDAVFVMHMFWISPSPALWRATNAAKARDLGADKPESWRISFVANSKLSDAKIIEKDKHARISACAHAFPDSYTIVPNYVANPEQNVKHGWHKND